MPQPANWVFPQRRESGLMDGVRESKEKPPFMSATFLATVNGVGPYRPYRRK